MLSLSVEADGSAPAGRPCTVAEVSQGSVRFSCEDAEQGTVVLGVSFEVSPPIEVAIDVGTAVQVKTIATQWAWEQPMLTTSMIVHDQSGALVLAAIDSNDLAWIPELEPFGLEQVEGACTFGPDESACLQGERLVWEAQMDNDAAIVADGTRTPIGDYAVHVQRAFSGELLDCVDVDTTHYELLISRYR
jgi:hypothetical protein